ncbi:MAG: Uma2 family endonuclease [Cyanosarcina radialis HA8281-LM2]|jgi:Uma2 family endonuclease|nr:Uma2 family endonuclease [Cyanosarcina radialis HA8281-LM2]
MVSQALQPDRAIVTDDWMPISWDEFVQLVEQPEYKECKAYYHNQKMRLETMPVGSDHAKEHLTLIMVISLFGICRNLGLDGRDNCTFRKVGHEEFQPDIAYYAGERANQILQGTRIVDLDRYPLPDLVIEVADATLNDDIGEKRLQDEELGISEYWVWDVRARKIIAFAIATDCSSRRIRVSEVLPGFDLNLLETAMRRSWQSDQSAVGQWLMEQWR